MVRLLKEHGLDDLTIGEGSVLGDPRDRATAAHAFETLGYNKLKERHGLKTINTFERPFRKMDLGQGVELNINQDILASDFVIDLPVLKTHAQTVVSLGIKNLKGMIDIESRKRCHNADPKRDLDFHVARLDLPMPPLLTLIDGTYSAEYGPGFDALVHRRDLLLASWDVLAADMAGAALLGHDPAHVPHLVHNARRKGRGLDLADLEIRGERLEDHARLHHWAFPYTEDETLPLPLAKKGLKGLSYRKYDSTLCTYCSGVNGAILAAIARAWQGEPWDEVEVLTGKAMQPRPGARKTILLGKCMYQAHKDNPEIREAIPIKGCPPQPVQIVKALHQAGIMVEEGIIRDLDSLPGLYLKRYQGQPEFDEGLFRVD